MKLDKPFIATPPGATIRDELEERGISQERFAELIGQPYQVIADLLNGRCSLSSETASQLEAVLGIEASFWQRLEAAYRSDLSH